MTKIVGTKFQLKLTILIFWTKFAQREYSGLKQKKRTILNFKLTILNFSTKFAQNGYVSSPKNHRDNKGQGDLSLSNPEKQKVKIFPTDKLFSRKSTNEVTQKIIRSNIPSK